MYYYSPFRSLYKKTDKNISDQICAFCNEELIEKQSIKNTHGVQIKNKHYVWLVNFYPKFEGHTMIVPIKHICAPLTSESDESLRDRHNLIIFAQKIIQELYPGCGIEQFLQYGPGSASSVKHIHWHIVPAMPNDPLRSFEKLGHFYTTKKSNKITLDFPITIKYDGDVLLKKLAKVIDNKTI